MISPPTNVNISTQPRCGVIIEAFVHFQEHLRGLATQLQREGNVVLVSNFIFENYCFMTAHWSRDGWMPKGEYTVCELIIEISWATWTLETWYPTNNLVPRVSLLRETSSSQHDLFSKGAVTLCNIFVKLVAQRHCETSCTNHCPMQHTLQRPKAFRDQLRNPLQKVRIEFYFPQPLQRIF